MGHRADHPRLGVEREHRGLEPDLARGFPLRCAGPAQLLAQPGADDPRGLALGGRAGEVDARLQVHRTRAAADVGGVVDVVHRHAVVHEREVLVREVGRQVVEGRLGRSQLQAAEQDVALRERLDHAAVLADADPELPERERVIAEAVHQHFLEPVPQRLLLLERAAERELRLRADADHLGNGVVADRGGVDRRLHVEQGFGGVQLCGRRVRAQPEAARTEDHVDRDPDRVHHARPVHAHAGTGPHPPAQALRDRRDHRVVAGAGELEALRVRPADHDERRARREVVQERRVAGVHLPEVAARQVAGLVEREEVARAGRIGAQHRPEAEVVLGEAVVRLPVERVAHQRLCVAVAVLVLVVSRRVRHERAFAHDPQRLVEVALVPARRHLAVDRHLGVRVHLREHLVVNRIRDQRHAGEHGPAKAPHAGRVVLDPDALRHGDDAAVITLHPVREAPVRRVVILVAGVGGGVGEVNQIHRAVVGVGARLRVERLPAGARDFARRVRQVQLVQAIGPGDLELRASIAGPVDDIALPEIDLDARAHVEQGERDRRPVQVHVVGEVAHHPVGVAERERGVVGLVAHALRDAVEVDQPRLVELPAHRATPVGEIDRGIPGLERLDLDERDDLLDLREQSGLESRPKGSG